jgi:GNAT superfamily N-acetyltransferase
MAVQYTWRGEVDSDALERLHAEGFDHEPVAYDWAGQLERHSLGWVTAHDRRWLVGFVNVAWDGGSHAFLLDTLVAASHRRRGIGVALVRMATREAAAAGCQWLHVDFEDHLAGFYLEACGFAPVPAGTIDLTARHIGA